MLLRRYRSADCAEIAKLFYDTVHNVNIRDYSAEQVGAWADGNIDLAAWDRSFSEHYTVVAEENGVIVGFGDITEADILTVCMFTRTISGRVLVLRYAMNWKAIPKRTN